ELAVDDSSSHLGSDSGSDVMALDEGLSDPDLSSVDEMLIEDEQEEFDQVDDEDEEEELVERVPAAQAEWGALDLGLLAVSVLVMFVAGLMSFELLRGMGSYHSAS